METPFAKAKRQAMNAEFDSEALTKRITKLLKDRNESLREAALESGLDHQALRRFMAGQRPNMIACILLADHFDVNPNEFLQLAGWPALKVFDIQVTSAENLPPEAVDVAKDIARISDPGTRKMVSEAVRALLTKYFE
jgi:transcriptional regulator with XRE-family HTH domain